MPPKRKPHARDHEPRHSPKHAPPHQHDHDEDEDHPLSGLEGESAAQAYMMFRMQNVEILKLAAQVAGFGPGVTAPKSDEPKPALDRIWTYYAEFLEWIDPEIDDEGPPE
jgi:hypothetical protein